VDFTPSEEQRLLADSARRWVAERCGFEAWQAERRGGGSLVDLRWPEMHAMGWAALALPEADGGLGAGPIECGLVAEALGRGLAGEPFLQSAVMAAALMRALPSSPARNALAREMAESPARLVIAHAESAQYDDEQPPQTAAKRVPEGWRLDGAKTVVMGAARATWIVVSASGSDGPLLFMMPPDAPGLMTTHYATVDAQDAADLHLRSLVVPDGARLCAPGAAMPALARSRDAGLAAIGAESIGLMDLLLHQTLDHTRSRRQFGQPLSSFQALRHRLVDMFMQLEAARSLVLLATLRLAEGDAEAPRALAAMKVKVGQAGRFIGQQAIQLHGGMGMTDDLVIGHAFKRLMALDARLGNTDHHLQRMAALAA
jgi:alkylation response protein AidB-like acyl-CoA dehydrogenase